MTRLLAVAALVLLLFATGAASLEGPRLVRVTAITVEEQGDDEETSDELFTNVDLRGSEGNLVGSGALRCVVGLDIADCLGTYILKRGRLMVQGTRQRRDFYVLAIVGGTGIYSNVGGTLVATTLELNPRRERLLFSVES